ncbi:transposable element Tcb2 transposase [Trichonephila clavipes]|nr:transposable element Tcb2 transposase [Trichonephila clavipes]
MNGKEDGGQHEKEAQNWEGRATRGAKPTRTRRGRSQTRNWEKRNDKRTDERTGLGAAKKGTRIGTKQDYRFARKNEVIREITIFTSFALFIIGKPSKPWVTAARKFGKGFPRKTTAVNDLFIILRRKEPNTSQQVPFSATVCTSTWRQGSQFTVPRSLQKGGLFSHRPECCIPLKVGLRRHRLEWCKSIKV